MLRRTIGRDSQAMALAIDGWAALKSLLPPPERRAVILFDPCLSNPESSIGRCRAQRRRSSDSPTASMGSGTRSRTGARRGIQMFDRGAWPAGLLPRSSRLKSEPQSRFRLKAGCCSRARLSQAGLCWELKVQWPDDHDRLNGRDIIIINPPYLFEPTLQSLLSLLAGRLGEHGPGQARLQALCGQTGQMATLGRTAAHDVPDAP